MHCSEVLNSWPHEFGNIAVKSEIEIMNRIKHAAEKTAIYLLFSEMFCKVTHRSVYYIFLFNSVDNQPVKLHQLCEFLHLDVIKMTC